MEINKIAERFNQGAALYDSQRKLFIPCFDDYYGTSISFLAKIRNDFKEILDLGAGTGLLTHYLYEQFPGAQFTLIDISNHMLEIARKRFSGLNNFHFDIHDYSKKLPANRFDLIASALSIHHLEDEDKAFLYSNVSDALEENGYFVNLDQFNASSEFINQKYMEFWHAGVAAQCGGAKADLELWRKRRDLDKENTIDETIAMLKNAGFKTIECIYRYLNFGVILAIK